MVQWVAGIAFVVILMLCAGISFGLLTLERGLVNFVVGSILAILPLPIHITLALLIDRYEEEPLHLLVFAFLWGAIVVGLVATIINTITYIIAKNIIGTAIGQFLVIVISDPVIEELGKAAVLFILYRWQKDEFEGVVDGIVYAAMVGLGFAMTENITYYWQTLQASSTITTGTFFRRTVLEPYAHPLFTAMTGAGLGFARQSREPMLRKTSAVIGLTLAILLHIIWNSATNFGYLFLTVYLLVMVPAFTGMLVFAISSFRRDRAIIRAYLLPDVESGRISPVEYETLGTVRGRARAEWRLLTQGNIHAWRVQRRLHRLESKIAFHRWRVARGLREDHGREARYLRQLEKMRFRLTPTRKRLKLRFRVLSARNVAIAQATAVPTTESTVAEAPSNIWKVIFASAAGTTIAWYDFYLVGSLSAILAPQFFPETSPTAALLYTLGTFGAGFAARPFGALMFGRLGDVVGRKYAFLATLLLMGGATTLIGLLPGYAVIGIAAPIILLLIRLVQGLALGGEYGGAAVYVAEHAADDKRGFYTSFIQTTATLGLSVSLVVILVVHSTMGEASFAAWGWRIPFLLSLVLVGIAVYIRTKMSESPLFKKMKAEGKTSKSPLKESFGSRRNWGAILTVLFGAAGGQAVIWYVGQFYALFFLQNVLKVEFRTASTIVAIALFLGLPWFVFFGWLSDQIGRKKVMIAGNLLGALAVYPTYRAMALAGGAVDGATNVAANPNVFMLGFWVWTLLIWVGMVYGPIAAFLAETFPLRIRYTSVSLPYHLANGYFGGFLPLIATWVTTRTGNPFAGLWYPVILAFATFIIGMFTLKESFHTKFFPDEADTEAEDRPALDEVTTARTD